MVALRAREILDAAGLHEVEIFASGLLDEHAVARLVEQSAPITGFGVGTRMGVSDDAPAIDLAYKLTEYAGVGRRKLSPEKATLPGRKQVFRIESGGVAECDVLAGWGESLPGSPLLRAVMNRVGEEEPEPISLPTMVVWGREDPFFPLEIGERLADFLGAQLLVIDEARHGPNMEHHDLFNEKIAEFLR